MAGHLSSRCPVHKVLVAAGKLGPASQPPGIQAGQSGGASGMWRKGCAPLLGFSTALTGTRGEHSGPGPPGPGCRFHVWSEEEAERLGGDKGLPSLSLCPRPLRGWFWNDPVAHSKVHKADSGPQEGFQPAASSRTRTGRSWQGPGGARTAGLSGRAGAGLCFWLHASASSGLGLSRPVCHPLPLLSQPFFFSWLHGGPTDHLIKDKINHPRACPKPPARVFDFRPLYTDEHRGTDEALLTAVRPARESHL